METTCKGTGHRFTEICRREIGISKPLSFTRQISASQVLVERINLYGQLIGHEGCVNTVEFNSTGDLLVSGSDDKQIKFWDWSTKINKFSYPSGHVDNVFQAKIMPLTDDRKIVTSSGDGQVRLGQVLENGQVETKRLGKHQGCVYKLAVEPGSPHIFYSCGEDGLVQQFDLRSDSTSELFYCSSLTKDQGKIRLLAIVIDPRNPYYFAIGGSDEFARVYDIRKYKLDASSDLDRPMNTFCPQHLRETRDVHITGLAYSNTSELLATYNDELIYLFQKNMGYGPTPLSLSSEDLQKVGEAQVYSGHRNSRTVKGVSFFGPNDEYVLSGSDCGHMYIWKKKGAKLVRQMVGDVSIVNHLQPHPHMPVLATCGLEHNVKIWAPMSHETPPLPLNIDEVLSLSLSLTDTHGWVVNTQVVRDQIMEYNRKAREEDPRVTFNPDVIMHMLRLQRRQRLAYIERRRNMVEIESDEEDEGELYLLGLDGNASSEEGSIGDPRDCNIS